MSFRSLYFDPSEFNSNSFCTPQVDLAQSIVAGSCSDPTIELTDTSFPKLVSFTAPSLVSTSSCTSQFFYNVDQSSITKAVSKFDIVDIDPTTNQIILNLLDLDTIAGSYPITITAIHPKGQSYLTSSFSFTLHILPGNCADSKSTVVLQAPSIADQSYTYEATQGQVDVSVGLTHNSCGQSDVNYQLIVTVDQVNVSSDFITFDSATRLVSWYSQQILDAAIFTVQISATITTNEPQTYQQVYSFQINCAQPTCNDSQESLSLVMGEFDDQSYQIGDPKVSLKIDSSYIVNSLVCTSDDINHFVFITAVGSDQSSAFIAYNQATKTVAWESFLNENIGKFEIKVVSILRSESNEKSFYLTTTAPDSTSGSNSYITNKNSPILEFGSAFNQTTLNLVHLNTNFLNLGKPLDLDNDEIEVILEAEPQSDAFIYDPYTGYLAFSPQKLTEQVYGIGLDQKFALNIRLTDDNSSPRVTLYQLYMQVPFQSKEQSEALVGQIEEVKGSKFDFLKSNFYKQKQEETAQNIAPKFGNAILSKTGMLTVKFNQAFKQYDIEEIDQQVMQLQLIPADDEAQPSNLVFKTTEVLSDSVSIQVQFDDPLSISASGVDNLDEIEFKILNNFYFQTVDDHVRIQKLTTKKVKIPAQMKSESENQQISKASEIAESSATTAIASTFVVNAALGFGMSNVYDMLNSLQIMSTIEYMNVYTPANVASFYQFILKMAEFQFLPVDQIYPVIFESLKIDVAATIQMDQSDDRQLDEIDEQSRKSEEKIKKTKERLGTTILFMLMLVTYTILMMFFFLMSRFSTQAERYYRKLYYSFFWNHTLRLILESYLPIVMLSLEQVFVKQMVWSNWVNTLINLFDIGSLFIFLVSPLLMTTYFRSNHTKFRKPTFKKRFGDVVEGLSSKRKSSSNFFAIFCYRRLSACVLIVIFASRSYIQIMGTVLINQFVVIMVGYSDPFTSKNALKLEYFNESMVMISAYYLFVFTDFVSSPQTRYTAGYTMIGLAAFSIGLNMIVLIQSTSLQIVRSLKLRFIRKYRLVYTKSKKCLKSKKTKSKSQKDGNPSHNLRKQDMQVQKQAQTVVDLKKLPEIPIQLQQEEQVKNAELEKISEISQEQSQHFSGYESEIDQEEQKQNNLKGCKKSSTKRS